MNSYLYVVFVKPRAPVSKTQQPTKVMGLRFALPPRAGEADMYVNNRFQEVDYHVELFSRDESLMATFFHTKGQARAAIEQFCRINSFPPDLYGVAEVVLTEYVLLYV